MRKSMLRHADTPSLNIVPLLDVLLVLVAVLLLLTPFMAKSIHVDLPAATSGAVMTQDTAITLEVKSDGSVWFEGSQVNDWGALATRMNGATSAKVFADKGAAFVAITGVLDQLAQHDIHNVQFAVRP
jgi:biopolymer transport protein ExbD